MHLTGFNCNETKRCWGFFEFHHEAAKLCEGVNVNIELVR